MLMTFANSLIGNSMFMLSIEENTVYTENYDLAHVIRAENSSPAENSDAQNPGKDSNRVASHHHVQLTQEILPEKQSASLLTTATSSIAFLHAYPAYAGSSATITSPKPLFLNSRFIVQITPLQQSSVLLLWEYSKPVQEAFFLFSIIDPAMLMPGKEAYTLMELRRKSG